MINWEINNKEFEGAATTTTAAPTEFAAWMVAAMKKGCRQTLAAQRQKTSWTEAKSLVYLMATGKIRT